MASTHLAGPTSWDAGPLPDTLASWRRRDVVTAAT